MSDVHASRASPSRVESAVGDPATQVIEDLETLKVVADPVRIQLLMQLVTPGTVKEIARTLDVPPTRLYYHVKLLEDHGLLRVVHRRKVSGIEERLFQSTATSWTLSPDLTLASLESTGALGALFDLVHAELALALGAPPTGVGGSGVPLLNLVSLAMSDDEAAAFEEEMAALVERYVCFRPDPPAGKTLYHAFLAGYRAPHQSSRRRNRPDALGD